MILIKDATIVGEKIIQGDMLIDGNRIKQVGKDIGEKADEVIDAKGNSIYSDKRAYLQRSPRRILPRFRDNRKGTLFSFIL